MRCLPLISLLLPALAVAGPAEELIESLIQKKWEPLPVRVEWQFRSGSQQDFDTTAQWRLDDPLPRYLSGSLILNLIGERSDGGAFTVPVSGAARIYGPSLTPVAYVPVGSEVNLKDLSETELEWTHVTDTPVLSREFVGEYIAARGLIPGRPICVRDLKRVPAVLKNQPVTLQYTEGNILIALAAEALADGAVGEIIPLRLGLENGRRCRGQVIDEKTVRYIQ